MARAFWAFVAFNIYSLFLISAFQWNVPYLFDAKLILEMRAAREIIDISDWGWKDHYIWRLFAAVVVTIATAFLAGAIAPTRGGRVAAIANIPSVLMWVGILYFMASGQVSVEGQTGFLVVSLVAIPLTTWLAYSFGNVGAQIQASNFDEDTVFGIRPYHWAWLVVPLYFYSLPLIFVVAKFFALQFLTWRDMSLVGAFLSLLAFVPLFAWYAPPRFAYDVLSGESLSDKGRATKAAVILGLLVGGGVLAMLVQVGCFWLLQKIMSWWYL